MMEEFHKALMLCHVTGKAYQHYASNEHEARHMPKLVLLADGLFVCVCVCICVRIRPLRPSELTVDFYLFQSRWSFPTSL
jgi:hypothetical protein